MPLALVETGHCNVSLKSSPIEPSWILEGNPEARSNVLSTSACKTTTPLIWSTRRASLCTTTRRCPTLWLNRRGYSRIRSGPLFEAAQCSRPYSRALA
jgi:hypothetical protein